jgi:L-alanine-DL-glutamate epimerase-like enolase superfamily enzyme
MVVVNGEIKISDAPGLGFELNEDALYDYLIKKE